MTRVFYADISCLLNARLFEKALYMLPKKSQEKISGKKPILNKCQSLGAWLLLEYFFKEFPEYDFEKEIVISKAGKPYFKNCSSLHFSLSHSENIALCAVSTCEIGADVQKLSEFNEKICHKYFSNEENEYVQGGNSLKEKKKRFAMVWALKEAYVKRNGEGLSGIKKLSLPIKDGILKEDFSGGFFKEFEEDDFFFAFCTEEKEDDFEIKKINLLELLIN